MLEIDNIINSFLALKNYCEREQFKGWDPYDGLNSKVFQALPLLKKSALCRLVVIQGFKRCPFNLRKLVLVPKEYNAKGIGLFLSGYCNLYHVVHKHPEWSETLGTLEEIKNRINELSELLISLQSKGYSGACWGYNFDWQARRLFLFPKYTPTIVATNFCATALIEAYEITKHMKYLEVALSAANFVIKDLHRTSYKAIIIHKKRNIENWPYKVYELAVQDRGTTVLGYMECYLYRIGWIVFIPAIIWMHLSLIRK